MHFRKIAVLAVGLLLTGCAQGADTTSAVENQQIKETQADALVASETWAKAAESGMSAAFGVLHNDSDQPLALHQVSNALGDEIQIHEMRGSGHDMSMAQLDGDLVIEPGQDLVLAPGGNHFMFMDLKRPLLAAQSVRLQLEFADGSSAEVDFPIRNFDGAKESYDEHGHGEH
ncbi:copper chaperone PCu(A)C [Glutamicibacter arilaitensis]|jgi:copper(I)-binding protein|uniref:Copper chaperone PCu(A)C n=1 Tax=Glutamicibacter arilaitensis TaxID=256701 RepID=A0A4Y8TXR2_9MICC|nr:copper chaperone PCu(A)C [Glutamicibacter arilaitensis]TFH56381.1 copper chaperone PCu(A)C [Glutamicibacter arilaitensis]